MEECIKVNLKRIVLKVMVILCGEMENNIKDFGKEI